MRNYKVVLDEYIDYLYYLRKAIFKILPLYEERNEYLIGYIDDTIEEVIYVKEIIEELPHGMWYIQTLDSLLILRDEVLKSNNKKKVKKRVFSTGNTIIQQINQVQSDKEE